VVEVPTAADPLFEVFLLTINGQKYIVDDLLTVYNPLTKCIIVLTQEQHQLLTKLRSMLEEKVFGNSLPWTEAQKILARMDTAEVIDFETRQRFMVQRRGGTYHADVQPLTRADTAIMKQIYDGVWSWDRRAVLVLVDGLIIAASMNGMPHGQGALNNNFPGHFCIHFAGSITHATRSIDLGHQLMINKASGTIWSIARLAKPEQQVHNLAAALNQKDLWLSQLFMEKIDTAELERHVAAIDIIEIHSAVLAGPVGESCQVAVEGEIVRRGGSRIRISGTLELFATAGVWRVVPASLLQIIN